MSATMQHDNHIDADWEEISEVIRLAGLDESSVIHHGDPLARSLLHRSDVCAPILEKLLKAHAPDGLPLSDLRHVIHDHNVGIRELFAKLDTNGDGFILRHELRYGLSEYFGIDLTDWQVQNIYWTTARDCNKLSLRDLSVQMASMPTADTKELAKEWVGQAGSFFIHHDNPSRTTFHLGMAANTLIAGTVAGAFSRTVTAPMDRVSAILRAGHTVHAGNGLLGTATSIVRQGGVLSLWRGNGVNCIQVGPESAMTFFFYEFLKGALCANPTAPTSAEKFGIGAIAGATSMTIMYPMYVLQARMSVAEPGKYFGLADCLTQTIRQEGGLRALTKGYLPSIMRVLPLKGSDLCIYQTLREQFVVDGHVSTTQSMMFGATSSSFSQTLTYPLMLARTRLQNQGAATGRPTFYNSMFDVWRKTVNGDKALGLAAEGMPGLYKGCVANLCKFVPAVAVQFAVYEKVLEVLHS